MKNYIVLLFLITYGFSSAQKKSKTATPKEPASVILTKNEDLVVEMIKGNFYTFRMDGKAKKDTLLLKNFTGTQLPTDFVVKKFKVKEVPMYYITWNEKSIVETPTKKEEITKACCQIWDPKLKSKVFDNEQKSTKIKEQVFLDKLKTASETQERMRNEGYTVTLLPSGDFTLKNKTVESKYVYNPITMKFEVPVKTAAAVTPKPVNNKKK